MSATNSAHNHVPTGCQSLKTAKEIGPIISDCYVVAIAGMRALAQVAHMLGDRSDKRATVTRLPTMSYITSRSTVSSLASKVT